MSILAQYYFFIKKLAVEFPSLRVEHKKGKWVWLRWLLLIVTFGRHDFWSYPSSIGDTFWVPVDWHLQTLRHHHDTLVAHRKYFHTYQILGRGNLWLGFLVWCSLFGTVQAEE